MQVHRDLNCFDVYQHRVCLKGPSKVNVSNHHIFTGFFSYYQFKKFVIQKQKLL